MIFPKGRLVHENLKTAFTQFDALISDLKQSHFTGYLHVDVTDYDGVLFFKAGKVVSAFDEMEGNQRIGGASAETTAGMARTKEGCINVYALPVNFIAPLYELRQAQLKHKNLSSDFASLDGLIAKVQEGGLTACIEVNSKNADGEGLVFIKPQQPVNSAFWINDQASNGNEALPKLMELTRDNGATFNVYLQPGKIPQQKPTKGGTGLALRQQIEIWENIIGCVEETVDRIFTNGHFMNTFQGIIYENKGEYPFLRRIRETFEYRTGKITFSGNPTDLHEGLGSGLSVLITELASQKPQESVSVMVKLALQPIIKKHAVAMQNFDLKAKCGLFEMSFYEQVIGVSLPILGEKTTAFIERQCSKKLKVIPEGLAADDLWALAQAVEKNAALMVSREKAQELKVKIESLAD